MDRSSFQQRWLGYQEMLLQKNGTGRHEEQASSTALVMSLIATPVTNALAEVSGMSEEAIKDHQGVHVTFVILKMLSAGWSSVPLDGDTGGRRKVPGKPAPREKMYGEKYACMLGESVKAYTYELVNKKGAKGKGPRADEFVCFSPGMVVSGKIFGNKVAAVFGRSNSGDLLPFQLATVQLGLKSLTSSCSIESGHMLDIKCITAMPHVSISSPRILPLSLFGSTLQSNNIKRDNFLAGLSVPEEHKEGLNMSMIRSSLSLSFAVVDVGYLHPKQGVFAVAPDGKLRMHILEPIGDIQGRVVDVHFDARDHGCKDLRWIAQLFNVCSHFSATRLIVTHDGYKNKNLDPLDQVVNGYAYVDPTRIVHALSSNNAAGPLLDSGDEALINTFKQQAVPEGASILLYPSVGPEVDVAVNAKIMKRTVVSEDKLDAQSSVVNKDTAKWDRAWRVNVFFQKKPVLAFAVPVSSENGMSQAVQSLSVMPLSDVSSVDGAEYEAEEEAGDEPVKKKSKKSLVVQVPV